MRRGLAGGAAAALLALASSGCGGDKADLTEPAMALPRATVAMLAVDLRAGGEDGARARDLAADAGYRSPLLLAGPAARAVWREARGRGAIFLLAARDGRGLNSGAVMEARDHDAALAAAKAIRPLVRAERERRGGVVRGGSDLAHALARLRASPTAAAAVGRWLVWGDPRAVRAAVIAANGRSLGETVPFRRAVEPFRGKGPGLVYVDPRPLGGALVAGALSVSGRQGAALADQLLGVRFARPFGGAARLHEHHVSVETGAEDGCPAVPLADVGGAPSDAQLAAGLPLYGLAQRQCRRRAVKPLRFTIPGVGVLDVGAALGWLQPSRVAVQGHSIAVAARVADAAHASRVLPQLRRALDRLPGVRARLRDGGQRLEVRSRALPPVRLVVKPHRALLFIGTPPPPAPAQLRTTTAYRDARRLLGDRRLTALARDPAPGVELVAAGAPSSGAGTRGSGARIVIGLRPAPPR